MGESSKFQKSWTFETHILKLAVCLQNINNSSLNGQFNFRNTERQLNNLTDSGFWGWLSMESQPQDPEFRNSPENFHTCLLHMHPNYLDG